MRRIMMSEAANFHASSSSSTATAEKERDDQRHDADSDAGRDCSIFLVGHLLIDVTLQGAKLCFEVVSVNGLA